MRRGLDHCLYLGNLDAKRDWGHAKDYVEGMWRMLQQDTPDDYVLATGETRSVREFVEAAFAHIGRRLRWSGKDVDETGIDAKSGATLVKIDPRYFRPTEVELLIGDATKARTKFGWQPTQTFHGLVTEMMDADLAQARRDAASRLRQPPGDRAMAKVVILGGGGFLGSHLAALLAAQGHQVRVFNRARGSIPQTTVKASMVTWHIGEFGDAAEVERALAGQEFVFHLVSTTLPKSSNERPVFDVESNVAGTIRMLEAACRQGIKRVVFLSSGGTVYGIPKSNPIYEPHPTDPICSYGITKLAIEKYLALFRHLHGLDTLVLRLSNPYGPPPEGRPPMGAVGVFLDRALNGREIEIWGDGSVVRDYVHVSDVVAVMARCLDYGGAERVFNIGSGTGTSLNDIVAALKELLGVAVAVRHLPSRAFDVPSNVLDVSRARSELGWRPKIGFAEGLAQMAAESRARAKAR